MTCRRRAASAQPECAQPVSPCSRRAPPRPRPQPRPPSGAPCEGSASPSSRRPARCRTAGGRWRRQPARALAPARARTPRATTRLEAQFIELRVRENLAQRLEQPVARDVHRRHPWRQSSRCTAEGSCAPLPLVVRSPGPGSVTRSHRPAPASSAAATAPEGRRAAPDCSITACIRNGRLHLGDVTRRDASTPRPLLPSCVVVVGTCCRAHGGGERRGGSHAAAVGGERERVAAAGRRARRRVALPGGAAPAGASRRRCAPHVALIALSRARRRTPRLGAPSLCMWRTRSARSRGARAVTRRALSAAGAPCAGPASRSRDFPRRNSGFMRAARVAAPVSCCSTRRARLHSTCLLSASCCRAQRAASRSWCARVPCHAAAAAAAQR
jgi:hypothetical protein